MQCRRHGRHRVQSLGWEDPLEEEMATYLQYSWQKNLLIGYSLWGHKELNMTEHSLTRIIIWFVTEWYLVRDLQLKGDSLMTQTVKNLSAMQETWVWSLGWENPLEKGIATHSSILARRIPWTDKPYRLETMRLKRVRHDWSTNNLKLETLFKILVNHFWIIFHKPVKMELQNWKVLSTYLIISVQGRRPLLTQVKEKQ